MGSDADLRKLEAKIRKKEEEKGVKPAEAQQGKEKPKKEEIKSINILRMAETNLDGNRKVIDAIRKVRGISFMTASVVVELGGFGGRRLGELSDEERAKLEDIVMHIDRYGLPAWMCNRRRDPRTGKTVHLAVSELDFAQKTDIDFMKKLRTYKGIRHGLGLPVRGQRTRSSFRKGRSVGVVRKKEAPAKAGEKSDEKKK